MDGCAPGALPLVRAKAFATAVNGEPSARFATRMAKFGPGLFSSYQAVSREQPFPGAGGVPIIADKRIVGAIATGLGVGPFVRLRGVAPAELIADGAAANLEDVIISFALGGPYVAQHGDDLARWIEAYGSAPDPALRGTAMDPVPAASAQFGLNRARAISEYTMAQAAEKGVRASIAVVDALGDVVTLDRMDGAPPMGMDVAAATAVASVNFGVPSGEVATLPGYEGALHELMDVVPYRMLAMPGAHPLNIGSEPMGAIGVHCHDLSIADDLARRAATWSAPNIQGDRQ